MKILLIFLMIINLLAFIIYGLDKRKAIEGKWRISEAALICLAAFGGGVGALCGMMVWHHKTKKWKFKILVPLFLVAWVVVLTICVWQI